MEQEQSAYITSVHLKGYKSIRDVSVTLNKGLNILIGANGSGKTNFLEFLDAAYMSDYDKLLNGREFSFQIDGIIQNEPYSVNVKGNRIYQKSLKGVAYRLEKEIVDSEKITYFLNENKQLIRTEANGKLVNDVMLNFLIDPNTESLYLTFENPLIFTLSEAMSINLDIGKVTTFNGYVEKEEDYGAFTSILKTHNRNNSFLNKIFDRLYDTDIDETLVEIIEKTINNQWFIFDELNKNLKQFTPIKDVRVDWALTRRTLVENDASIEGIYFQFYVNNEWLNWTQLSDGTKRLFYLIGSVTYAQENEIILIEEPELGVHPHQLALLMNFLKSQSREKQIIISTHSPQVLNCLGEYELDRIIVARHEGKAGTKLYHLSEEEKGYASEYMKNEAFLSDYWMLSGFMNEEPAETL